MLSFDQLEILRIIIKLEKGNLQCKTFIRGIKNSRGGKDLTVMDEEEIMRAIIQRAIEERNYESYYSKSHRRVQLVNLWDKCLIHQHELESVDEVYELLSQVSRLQELYVKCAANGCWKDKMIEFEKKGIRHTSFFQSSFQLLEEENEENLVGLI
ncbi:hypothetical protein Glove_71g112 [Diversispora epigaea]|uniref:Uncharacterized protein n=1 Tax=Diversispora epigaea TaxID=1348612 RepID=A0A397JJD7_9GLOM|nr:hypothetical protein Glove_71g112 [Diversispora epigaea]